jgi:hypothetical protein
MGQAGPVIISLMIYKDLSFIFQTTEGRRMDNAIPIPLINTAILMFVLWIFPALGIITFHSIGGKLPFFPQLDFFSC